MQIEFTRRDFLKTASAAAASFALGPGVMRRAWANELARYDGLGLAGLVRQREVTALELLEAAIQRAAALNPALNAIVTPMYELARARAQQELPSRAFEGVPTLLKDLDDFAGVRTAFGSRLMMDNIAKDTHPIGQAMEKMGMVIFGKSATPEFGLLPSTEPLAFGATANPWNTEYSPGGSSGGAAAAVASGIVPIAQASDGGGSIRIPASNCGLFGLKPSRGRVVERPGTPAPGDLSVKGFVSRSVRDSEAALAGVDALNTALPRVTDEPPKREGLRIAYTTSDFNGVSAHPEVVQAIEKTAKLCESLGHVVEEGKPPINGEEFSRAMLTLWSDRPWSIVEGIKAQSGRRPPEPALEPWTWGLIHWMDTQNRDEVVSAAEAYMKATTERLAQYFKSVDIWLSPVLAEPPAKTGEMAPDRPYEELYDRVINVVGYTPIANATGVPAMSVPLHWTSDGLPVGSHFVAPLGEERTLFALAKQLEDAQPWSDKWPLHQPA